MATLDHQEQEQLDNLKHLWHDYGRTIAMAIVAGVIGYGAVQAWKAWGEHRNAQAAEAYAPFEQALKTEKPDLAKLNQMADSLQKEYPKSVYAARADLFLAKQAFESGDLKTAQSRLEWVIANNKDPDLLVSARLRLAAVLVDSNKPDDALKVLDAEHPAAYDSIFAETRGDILAQKGQKAAAKQAYQKALATAEPSRKMLLDWKLEALGA